ncbi:hypothetical protein ROZALSC1DRAFT_31108, partial [Rozella allomycis CSF55]
MSSNPTTSVPPNVNGPISGCFKIVLEEYDWLNFPNEDKKYAGPMTPKMAPECTFLWWGESESLGTTLAPKSPKRFKSSGPKFFDSVDYQIRYKRGDFKRYLKDMGELYINVMERKSKTECWMVLNGLAEVCTKGEFSKVLPIFLKRRTGFKSNIPYIIGHCKVYVSALFTNGKDEKLMIDQSRNDDVTVNVGKVKNDAIESGCAEAGMKDIIDEVKVDTMKETESPLRLEANKPDMTSPSICSLVSSTPSKYTDSKIEDKPYRIEEYVKNDDACSDYVFINNQNTMSNNSAEDETENPVKHVAATAIKDTINQVKCECIKEDVNNRNESNPELKMCSLVSSTSSKCTDANNHETVKKDNNSIEYMVNRAKELKEMIFGRLSSLQKIAEDRLEIDDNEDYISDAGSSSALSSISLVDREVDMLDIGNSSRINSFEKRSADYESIDDASMIENEIQPLEIKSIEEKLMKQDKVKDMTGVTVNKQEHNAFDRTEIIKIAKMNKDKNDDLVLQTNHQMYVKEDNKLDLILNEENDNETISPVLIARKVDTRKENETIENNETKVWTIKMKQADLPKGRIYFTPNGEKIVEKIGQVDQFTQTDDHNPQSINRNHKPQCKNRSAERGKFFNVRIEGAQNLPNIKFKLFPNCKVKIGNRITKVIMNKENPTWNASFDIHQKSSRLEFCIYHEDDE